MSQIQDPGNNSVPILTESVIAQILKTGKWAEDPALTLVINDMHSGETAKAAKQWITGWNSASILYQSTTVPRYWEGTQVERANIPFYTVAKAVNSLVPQIVTGLFYDDPPFIFQPRPGTKQDTAEAISNIISFQLKEINFKEEVRRGVLNATLYGTNIWKWGWESRKYTRTYYARDEKPDIIPSNIPGQPDTEFYDPDTPLVEKTEEIVVERPKFENITSIKDVIVAPTLRTPDIREAKFVIHRTYLTYNDLDQLRDTPGYDIPSKEEVASWFMPPAEEAIPAPDENTGVSTAWDMRSVPRWLDDTDDPFQKPLEVLERWDKEKVIIVVQQKKVISNQSNPYGEIPFFSIGWWDVPQAFYSLGLARTIGSEQRLQQGIVNNWLDNTALNLAGVYTRKRGKSIPTQSLRIHPGRVFEVDEKDDLRPLERTPSIPEAGQHLSLSQSRAEENSGAGAITSQGIAGSSGHSNIARTATGAGALTAGQGIQIAEFVEKFCTQVFLPFIYRVHVMNKNLLPATTVKKILNEELQSEYLTKGGRVQDIKDAMCIFEVQAGAKIKDRQAMAQALPILIQYLEQNPVIQALAMEGKKIDQNQITKMVFESSGWRSYYSVVVDMTPEEKQQAQANQPGAIAQKQQQAAQAQLQMKLQNTQELANQNGMNRAAQEVLRHSFETAATPETLTGEPGTQGFGSSL